MDKTTIRKAVKFTVALCVGSVVKNVLQSNIEPETTFQKAEVVVGSYVLGAMIADLAADYAGGWMNTLLDMEDKSTTDPLTK